MLATKLNTNSFDTDNHFSFFPTRLYQSLVDQLEESLFVNTKDIRNKMDTVSDVIERIERGVSTFGGNSYSPYKAFNGEIINLSMWSTAKPELLLAWSVNKSVMSDGVQYISEHTGDSVKSKIDSMFFTIVKERRLQRPIFERSTERYLNNELVRFVLSNVTKSYRNTQTGYFFKHHGILKTIFKSRVKTKPTDVEFIQPESHEIELLFTNSELYFSKLMHDIAKSLLLDYADSMRSICSGEIAEDFVSIHTNRMKKVVKTAVQYLTLSSDELDIVVECGDFVMVVKTDTATNSRRITNVNIIGSGINLKTSYNDYELFTSLRF